MARYIDADKLLEEVKRGGHVLQEWSTLGVCAVIERQPMADVIPKSEVDDWIITAKENLIRIEELEEELKNIKAEVAREIFAEIDRIFDGKKYVPYPLYEISELKKKYTEEQK